MPRGMQGEQVVGDAWSASSNVPARIVGPRGPSRRLLDCRDPEDRKEDDPIQFQSRQNEAIRTA